MGQFKPALRQTLKSMLEARLSLPKPGPELRPGLSKASQFRALPTLPPLLKHIERLQLGIRSGESLCFPLSDILFQGAPPKLVATVANAAELKPSTTPELAFIGRSNVGKSSMINALLTVGQRKSQVRLASVSSTPGHTQALHFYLFSGTPARPLRQRLNLTSRATTTTTDRTTTATSMNPNEPKTVTTAAPCVWVDMPGYGFAFGSPDKVANYPDLVRLMHLYIDGISKRMNLSLYIRLYAYLYICGYR